MIEDYLFIPFRFLPHIRAKTKKFPRHVFRSVKRENFGA